MAPCESSMNITRSPTTSPTRIHITDLYFQAEIAQVFGSAASRAWYYEHGIRTRSTNSRVQTPTSLVTARRSQYDPLSSSQPDSLRSDRSMIAQSQKHLEKAEPDLQSEILKLQSLASLQPGYNFGLLYTDAAHTVLSFFDIR
jgi:hypothetical protein